MKEKNDTVAQSSLLETGVGHQAASPAVFLAHQYSALTSCAIWRMKQKHNNVCQTLYVTVLFHS